MPKILDLPTEILSLFGEVVSDVVIGRTPVHDLQITLRDVLRLRLVCKPFAEALMGMALNRIVINTASLPGEEGCRLGPLKSLAEMSQEHHPVRVLARTLCIKSFKLDPGIENEALGYLSAVGRNLARVDNLVYVSHL
jgi:hypothetical protein